MATNQIDIPTKVHKGWARRRLAQEFKSRGFTKGAEIGVRTGKYSAELCRQNPNLHLLSIDPYDLVYDERRSHEIGKEGQQQFFEDATELLKGFNAEIIRKTSLEAAQEIENESLDFVYIDGAHQFDYVMTDVIVWGWKVRKGGVISGHDYYKFRDGGIVRAVDNYAAVHGVKGINLTDEKTPSWWFERTW